MVKKAIIVIMSMFVILTPMQVFASNTVLATNSISPDSITPNIVVTREKTVVKAYSDRDSIPDSISYSEYSDGVWWHGTLFLKATQEDGTIWYATFKGYIQANI